MELRLGIDPEQLRRGTAEHRYLVGVANPGDRQDVVDRRGIPRERVVGAHDHMFDPDLGDQVTHGLAGEHDRVEIELAVAQVFRRVLFWVMARLGRGRS